MFCPINIFSPHSVSLILYWEGSNGGAGRIEPLYKTTDVAIITDMQRRQANPNGELVVQDLAPSNNLWAELWAISKLLS